MKQVLLWFLAFLITAASVFYQRRTGPTYPLRGKAVLAGQEINFKLPRSAENTSDCEIGIEIPTPEVAGRLQYKRFKTADPLIEVPMNRQENRLVGFLPKQPMAGKLTYQVFLSGQGKEISLTGEKSVIIRFKRHVPIALLLAHVLVIFLAMLFSTGTGLVALGKKNKPRRLVLATVVLLFLGGFVLGPLMQKFAFGAWWTGFPLGSDLTDTKTLVAMIVWLGALVAGRGARPNRGWILAAALLTLVVFMIPHSLLGSELKYAELKP